MAENKQLYIGTGSSAVAVYPYTLASLVTLADGRTVEAAMANTGGVKSVNGVSPDANGIIVLPVKLITKARAEEEITTEPMTSANTPKNKIECSSFWGSGSSNSLPAWKAFDGNDGTYWVANAGGTQWVEYVMDDTWYDLTRVVVRSYTNSRSLANLTIEVSADGETYETVYEQAEGLTPEVDTEVQVDHASASGFRRVRISSYKAEDTPSTNYVGIREIHLYGISAPPETSAGILVDLTNYYTKSEVDALLEEVRNE